MTSGPLGMTLVRANRSLKSLRDVGLILGTKDGLRLNDVNALIDMSQFNPEHLAAFRL